MRASGKPGSSHPRRISGVPPPPDSATTKAELVRLVISRDHAAPTAKTARGRCVRSFTTSMEIQSATCTATGRTVAAPVADGAFRITRIRITPIAVARRDVAVTFIEWGESMRKKLVIAFVASLALGALYGVVRSGLS